MGSVQATEDPSAVRTLIAKVNLSVRVALSVKRGDRGDENDFVADELRVLRADVGVDPSPPENFLF